MNETELFAAYRELRPTRSDHVRDQARKRKRAERDRYRERGLTADGQPRIPRRRAFAWATGPQHMPSPGADPARCVDCGRRVRRHRRDGREIG